MAHFLARASTKPRRDVFARYGLNLDPRAPIGSLSSAEQALFAIVRAVEDLRLVGQPRMASACWSSMSRRRSCRRSASINFSRSCGGSSRKARASSSSATTSPRSWRSPIARRCCATASLVDVWRPGPPRTSDFVERIVGRAVTPFHVHALGASHRRPAARLDKLIAPGLGPVSLDIGKGEIVGMTGLIGSGFDRVCAADLWRHACAAAGGSTFETGEAIDLAQIEPAARARRRHRLSPGRPARRGRRRRAFRSSTT